MRQTSDENEKYYMNKTNIPLDALPELEKYVTARINLKNIGNQENTIEIIKNSDINSKIDYPQWFSNETGKGLLIHSTKCNLDLEIKCINRGELIISLLGMGFTDKIGNFFPIFITFTSFKINDEEILSEPVSAWHNEPYHFKRIVKNSEIVKIHVEWKPFDKSCIFKSTFNDQENQIKRLKQALIKQGKGEILELQNQINVLKNELNMKRELAKAYPLPMQTSVGASTTDGKIIYRNFFPPIKVDFLDTFWLTKYLQYKFPDIDYKINIFSVYGEIDDTITKNIDGKKVFLSAEDINKRYPEASKFGRYALDYVDLGMGCDLINEKNYFRFPWWYLIFKPNVTDEQIENSINTWNSLDYDKTKNVTLVNSHDYFNVRKVITADVEKFTNIDYCGKWRHNNSDLWKKYGNNKFALLKDYKFNICAENLIDDAYVTEKIFHCLISNCVPLYAGGGNYLEPNVLNEKIILKWDIPGDNSDTVELFETLLNDEKSYHEFKDQNPFLDTSAKFIIKEFKKLEKHFERVIFN